MKVYSFSKSMIAFQIHRSISAALRGLANGDEKRVFVHVEGIPNPWWVHPVEKGKVNRNKILKHGDLK